MTTKSKVPQIRVRGFSGEWVDGKLSELGTFNPKAEIPEKFEYVDLESVVDTKMISHRTENKATAPSRAQRVALQGDLFYQTVRPYQKNNHLFNKPYKNYVFSTGYAQIRPYADGNFLLGLVQNATFIKDVLNNCTGTSYPAINSKDLANIDVYYPNQVEQTKIGDYFQKLDKLIEQKEKKYEKLKQFKKAMLSKMFPKNGADTPEIRFKGFSGKWEEKRLVEFLNLIHGDGDWILAQDITINGEYKIVQLGNIGLGKYIEKYLKTVSLKTFETLRGTPIKKGDLLINRMVDGNVNSCIFEFDGNYITSVDVCWIRENDYINNFFLMCLLIIEESQKKLLSLSSGSGRIRISKKNLFEKFYFVIPTVEEQTKIGNYFQKLDTQIELQLQEIEKLKNIKKASLAKMFV